MALADTGYWLALANRDDRWHERAKAVTQGLDETLVVTWPVLTETCHLLLSRLGVDAQLAFMAGASGNIRVLEFNTQRLLEMHRLMERYRDLPMDLADASLVLAAEDIGSGRILSTDLRDFHAYRWKNRHPFENLMT